MRPLTHCGRHARSLSGDDRMNDEGSSEANKKSART